MRRRYLILIVVIIALRITGCVYENNVNEGDDDSLVTISKSVLEVYNATRSDDLSFSYVMADEPMFTSEDIEIYEWSTHTIRLDKLYFDADRSANWLGGSTIFGTDSQDKFMVFVDGELIYEGYYEQSVLSSFMPSGAIMKDEADGVSITFIGIDESDEDLRRDERIYACLKSAGVLLDLP